MEIYQPVVDILQEPRSSDSQFLPWETIGWIKIRFQDLFLIGEKKIIFLDWSGTDIITNVDELIQPVINQFGRWENVLHETRL